MGTEDCKGWKKEIESDLTRLKNAGSFFIPEINRFGSGMMPVYILLFNRKLNDNIVENQANPHPIKGVMSMWVPCNPNPRHAHVEDCVVRAIAIATGETWYDTYDGLCKFGRNEANMPSANAVWGKYLYKRGFEPFLLPESCPECTTIRTFCTMFPIGTYIIGTGSHAVCVIDGDYYDSWDSGSEIPSYFWRIK